MSMYDSVFKHYVPMETNIDTFDYFKIRLGFNWHRWLGANYDHDYYFQNFVLHPGFFNGDFDNMNSVEYYSGYKHKLNDSLFYIITYVRKLSTRIGVTTDTSFLVTFFSEELKARIFQFELKKPNSNDYTIVNIKDNNLYFNQYINMDGKFKYADRLCKPYNTIAFTTYKFTMTNTKFNLDTVDKHNVLYCGILDSNKCEIYSECKKRIEDVINEK